MYLVSFLGLNGGKERKKRNGFYLSATGKMPTLAVEKVFGIVDTTGGKEALEKTT